MNTTKTMQDIITIKNVIKKHKEAILHALFMDLRKPPEEALFSEYLPVMQEISFCIKTIQKWNKAKRVWSPFMLLGCSSYIQYEPYGKVLIIAPWNYPFQLSILPVIGAIAAGNTVFLKPSELAEHTSTILTTIAQEANVDSLQVITGDHTVLDTLIPKSNYIFFTGSTQIGKIIYKKAAEHLIPVTLELGGKSPAIIEEGYNLQKAAEKILWGKLLNLGQTCIAPDHVYIPEGKKDEFLAYCIEFIKKYKERTGKIINARHYARLQNLLENQTIIYQEESRNDDIENLYFPFTIITNPSENTPVMQEEIFGPILPIIEYTSITELYTSLRGKQKPLALYIFRNDRNNLSTYGVSSGGLCFNATLLHILDAKLPFGGVGESGIGQYHGVHSLETFSHKKAVFQGHYLSVSFLQKMQRLLVKYGKYIK